MNISNKDLESATVVQFDGNLDTNTAQEAEQHLNGLISEGKSVLVVDFGALDYISSAGLRVLLGTAKKLGAAGGKLRIFGLNETVREIFDMSGFSTILQVFDREEDAMSGV